MARIAAAGAATFALAAAPATAHRAPTPEELTEMAGATGPPTEPDCVSGRISTVDVRWGALVAKHAPGCPRIERTWVLERDAPGTPGGRWRELRQGIRFGVCARDLPGIPDAVGVDLGVCAPPSRRVYGPSGDRLAFKPARLRYSRNATITGLRWSEWGGRTARGRGTFDYRDRYGSVRADVTVTLSGIDLCGSDRVYLSAQLTGVTPADRDAVRAYSGRWYRQCPGVTAN
ncbi:MAG TPA: hypothetical protein VLK58_11310 [Conexibacter sp.]|nr:hypothetical protein [Conexibacter sp.]